MKEKKRLKKNRLTMLSLNSYFEKNKFKKLASLNYSNQGDRTTKMLFTIFNHWVFGWYFNTLEWSFSDWFVQNVYIPLGELIDILALFDSAVNFNEKNVEKF